MNCSFGLRPERSEAPDTRKAANVYGKMVWQEIFNPRKTTMTPVMITDGTLALAVSQFQA